MATMIPTEAFTTAFDKSQTSLAPSCYWWPDLAETSGYASTSTTPSTDLQGSPIEWSAPHMYINSLDSSLGYLESLPSTSTMFPSDPAPFGYSTKVQPQIRPTLRTFNHVTRVKSEVRLPDLIEKKIADKTRDVATKTEWHKEHTEIERKIDYVNSRISSRSANTTTISSFEYTRANKT